MAAPPHTDPIPQTVWLTTPDGTRLRAAHWPAGTRGTVLLLNGRTEFIEKYHELIHELQTRGFAVWTLDWRGQGLSSRQTPDPHAGHVDTFEHYLADLDQLLTHHIHPTTAGRELTLLGFSMGAHLAARMLARHPRTFARAILVAPMFGVLPGGTPLLWLALAAATIARWRPSGSQRYAPGTRRIPDTDIPFHQNRVTSCPHRYAADRALIRANPTLALGGATWGWLRAALHSIAILRRPTTLRKITTPTLLILAENDRIVRNADATTLARHLKTATLTQIPNAHHELWREQDPPRTQMWQAMDAFLPSPLPRKRVG